MSVFMKIILILAGFYKETDVTKLIVAFRTFAKSPMKGAILLDMLFMTAEWKESIITLIYKKVTAGNNYRGISLLPTTYKILSNILLSRFVLHAEESTGDHQCGFGPKRSTKRGLIKYSH
jgi:hypothetical protein